MAIQFSCPRCQKPISVNESMGGTQGKCPSCMGIVTVPSAPRMPSSAFPTMPAQESHPRSEDDEPHARFRSVWRGQRDEEDDREVDHRERRKAERQASWLIAAKGANLNSASMWVYAVIWMAVLIAFVIGVIAAELTDGGYEAGEKFGRVLSLSFRLLILIPWSLSLAGCIFGIWTPGRYGASALAVAGLVLAGCCIFLSVITFLLELSDTRSWASPAFNAVSCFVLFQQVLEIGRTTVLACLFRSSARGLRDWGLNTRGVALIVAVPVINGVLLIINLILLVLTGASIQRPASANILLIVLITINTLVYGGLCLWFAISYRALARSMEEGPTD